MNCKKSIAVIGGGASALSFASFIDTSKFGVTIYEQNNALGRKFLVAGSGGFNLTHSENIEEFCLRYTPHEFISPFIKQFSNSDFRTWLKHIGIETYVGTSKRVFPVKAIKPIHVLKAIEDVLNKNNIQVAYEHKWMGFENDSLRFQNKNNVVRIKADIVIFALGGSSWSVTGSNENWLQHFKNKNVETLPFQASNGAVGVNWDPLLMKQIEGRAIKNALFSCGDKTNKGEIVITKFGLEGSGIYPLSPEIRKQLNQNGNAKLQIDFKPDLTKQTIQHRFEENSKLSTKDVLEKKINLSSVHTTLLKAVTTKEQYHSPEFLSQLIKEYPIQINALTPIDEAISTVGGISLNAVNQTLELKQLPNYYCLGEMLDWDAPTGGYLLQACFSMGFVLAKQLNKFK